MIGKITAVDADNHLITVDSVTVDVVRKTRITIEGEPSRLVNITVGQSANVAYDDKLEIATVIAVSQAIVRDEEKTTADMKTLQGKWICIAEEDAHAGVLDRQAVRETDRRVTISRNSFTMKRTLDNKRGTYTGKFEIDAATGRFDFIGSDNNGRLSEWIGIYEIKDDTWRLRYSLKTSEVLRPAKFEFNEDEVEKSRSRMFTFKRELD